MQLIPIDSILKGIEKDFPTEWKEYKSYLRSKCKAGVPLSECHGKDGVIMNGIIGPTARKAKKGMLGEWVKRSINIKGFDTLERAFTKRVTEYARFCPYCGKIPLINYGTTETGRKRTYHLDHFFPKSKYPQLALNFYNLIPACSICNQMKGTKNPIEKTDGGWIFHPYFGWFDQSGLLVDDVFWNKKIFNTGSHGAIPISTAHSKFFRLLEIYTNAKDTEVDVKHIRHLGMILKEMSRKAQRAKIPFIIEKRKVEIFKEFSPFSKSEVLNFPNGKLRAEIISDMRI